MTGGLLFAGLAGALSTLSPCVLPLLPIILVGAFRQSRLGPLALMGGLAVSFTGTGLLLATIGFSLDLSGGIIRDLGAAMLVMFGAILLVPRFQVAFASAAAPVSGRLNGVMERLSPDGLSGQFLLGALLGIVWVPCTGPTLGAALTLAAGTDDIVSAGLTMTAFSFGAVTPMLALAYGSQKVIEARRRNLAMIGHRAKPILGTVLLVMGFLVWSGMDKVLEGVLTQAMPEWMIRLTTMF